MTSRIGLSLSLSLSSLERERERKRERGDGGGGGREGGRGKERERERERANVKGRFKKRHSCVLQEGCAHQIHATMEERVPACLMEWNVFAEKDSKESDAKVSVTLSCFFPFFFLLLYT